MPTRTIEFNPDRPDDESVEVIFAGLGRVVVGFAPLGKGAFVLAVAEGSDTDGDPTFYDVVLQESEPEPETDPRLYARDASGVRAAYDPGIGAENAAYNYVEDGDYAHPDLGEWTSFIEVQVSEDPDGRGETFHVPLYPSAPNCNGMPGEGDDGHIWRYVYSRGDGGGVYVTEECVRCGLLKDTRTHAQCPDCGETVGEAIRYRQEEV